MTEDVHDAGKKKTMSKHNSWSVRSVEVKRHTVRNLCITTCQRDRLQTLQSSDITPHAGVLGQ